MRVSKKNVIVFNKLSGLESFIILFIVNHHFFKYYGKSVKQPIDIFDIQNPAILYPKKNQLVMLVS